MLRVGFYSAQLGMFGTETALFDYALYNESLLHHESVILTKKNAPGHDSEVWAKFAAHFPIRVFSSLREIREICRTEKLDVLYVIKPRMHDSFLRDAAVFTITHAVFPMPQPAGNAAAVVSPWLARFLRGLPVVPHIVSLPDVQSDLRRELGIPEEALVFGYHGARDGFDVPFAQQAVSDAVEKRHDMYFLFMNAQPLCIRHPRILYLPGTADAERKRAFINTCNAMLHARRAGETFGLSVAEFLFCHKPVLTFRYSPNMAHANLIRENGWCYEDYASLYQLLTSIARNDPHFFMRSDVAGEYSPENVMRIFEDVFLEKSYAARAAA